jgi:hypothetical protein
MSLEERMPMLRELTSLTGGADARMDQENLLESLRHQFNYQVIYDCITALSMGACRLPAEDNVSIGEGFVSARLAGLHSIEVHDADSHSFRNAIFEVGGLDPELLLTEVAPKALSQAKYGGFVASLLLDKDSGVFLLKVKEDISDQSPIAFTMESGGETFVLED